MARYIEADELKNHLVKNRGYVLGHLLHPLLEDIDNQPTVDVPTADVVEVVRCRDCKHNPRNSDDDVCPFVAEDGYVKCFPEDDGFCKWGERRDDE